MAKLLDYRAAFESVSTLRRTIGEALGRTFGGNRDVFEALGYKKELRIEDYWNRYRRNAVAARVIEAYPRGTWRGQSLELIENPDIEAQTTFEKEWDVLAQKLKIVPKLMKLDILSGIGRYGVLFIGCPGSTSEPAPKRIKAENITFLAPHAEDTALIDTYDENPTSPRFGWPETYKFKVNDTKRKTIEFTVHWTRTIHLTDNSLDNPVYSEPRLARVWNNIDDLEKVVGGGSEAFWLRAHQGYQFDLDKETELDAEEEEAMEEEVDAFVNKVQRFVKTRGVKLTALGSDVAMFDRNVDSIVSLISAGTGIPQRILMGSERGQLASEQDRVNWAERLQDRRAEFAGPFVVEPLADWFIEHGVLSKPEQYEPRWNSTRDLSDEERARIASKLAEVNQKQGKIVIKGNEIRDKVFGWGPLTDAEQEPVGQAAAPIDREGNGVREGTPDNI